jgi:hypothetical protein
MLFLQLVLNCMIILQVVDQEKNLQRKSKEVVKTALFKRQA